MYLNSGTDYYLVVLTDIEIVCKSGLIIRSPNIKYKLLSYPDINKIEIMTVSKMKQSDIYDEICKKCIVELIGFKDQEIDFNLSPAGIVEHIAFKIKENSRKIIEDIEQSYQKMTELCSLYERMAMVVAYYTNNTYEYTQQLPIDELLKRYTLCSIAFPNVPPIEFEKEEESKVG